MSLARLVKVTQLIILPWKYDPRWSKRRIQTDFKGDIYCECKSVLITGRVDLITKIRYRRRGYYAYIYRCGNPECEIEYLRLTKEPIRPVRISTTTPIKTIDSGVGTDISCASGDDEGIADYRGSRQGGGIGYGPYG